MGRNRDQLRPKDGVLGRKSGKEASGVSWVQVVVGLLVAVLVALIFRNAANAIENHQGASADDLKRLFFGDRPYVFYCAKGAGDDSPPATFVTLHTEMRSKIGFAILDCDQILPSGRTIKDRFKLKKKARDRIFATSPWGSPQQADSAATRDIVLFRKFIKYATGAHARVVSTDAEISKHCGFNSSVPASEVSPCLVMVKGTRFMEDHEVLEEKIIKGYKSLHVVALDATKKRLSIEDRRALAPDDFAMRLYALKGMKRSLNMIFPLEWENVQSFVSSVIRQPLSAYDISKAPITLVNALPRAKFKDRSARSQPPPQDDTSSSGRSSAEERKADREEAIRKLREQRASMTDEQKEEERKKREQRVRENMDKEAEDMFESADDGSGHDEAFRDEGNEEDEEEWENEDEEDEDIIEL